MRARARARLSARALESVWLTAFVVVCVAAAAGEARRVRDVRLGAHKDFDRIVIELDARARVERRSDPPGGLELWLEAQPTLPKQRLETARRLGRIDLDAGDGGVYVRMQPRTGRTRVFALERPFRVVVDVAPAGPTPLAIPEGAEAIPLAAAAPPAPPPVAEVTPPPKPAPAEPPRLPAAEPSKPPVAEVARPPVATPTPTPPVAEAPAPESPGAGKQTEPPPPPVPALPQPEPALPATQPAPIEKPPETRAPAPPAPRPHPAPPVAKPTPRPPEGEGGWPRWIGQGLATIAGLAGVAALVVLWVALRRRRTPPPLPSFDEMEEESTREPATIRSAEIVGAADRLEILEKRLDEEARARVALEERVTELSEELKLLRDRTNRLAKPGL